MSRRAQHERELRQHNLMLARIDQLESGRLAIGPTVNDLEALLYELELASETWRDAYIEEWSVLELAYAVALDRQQPLPGPEDPFIKDALHSLRRLTSDAVRDL